MSGKERGKIKDRWVKRLGRYHDKSRLMCLPMKRWTNIDGHKSSTETGFFLLHQRLAFPYVWVTIITWDRCTSPTPHKTTSLGGEEEMTPQEQNGKAVTQPTYQKSFPGVEIWEVAAWIMDVYQSVHQGWVKTTGKVSWLQTFGGTHM